MAFGRYVMKKSMTVSDNTIVAEALREFFKNVGQKGRSASKKMANSVLKKTRRALEICAIVDSAFASRSPKAALSSLPEVINFYDTGKGLYFGKIV